MQRSSSLPNNIPPARIILVCDVSNERKRVQVFVLNPRIFRRVIEVLRNSGVSFEVPDSPEALRDIAVVDREFLQVFGAPKAKDVIVIENVEGVETLMRKVLGVEEKSALVGVDVGAKIAYVIIQGNVVVGYGKVVGVDEFRQAMEKALAGTKKTMCHARVGIPASPELRKVAYEISEVLLRLGCEVRLTEEFMSSSEHPPPLIGAEKIKDSDIRAAINLALR